MSAAKLTAAQLTVLAALADFILSNGAATEPEADTPAEESDGLDELDRNALKALNNEEELGVSVTKQMDDDALRAAIREARAAAAEPEGGGEDQPAEEAAEPETSPIDELREVMKKLIAKKGDDAAAGLLKLYKVDKISKLPVAKIPEALKKAQALIKGK